jgi:hypothetical protein
MITSPRQRIGWRRGGSVIVLTLLFNLCAGASRFAQSLEVDSVSRIRQALERRVVPSISIGLADPGLAPSANPPDDPTRP